MNSDIRLSTGFFSHPKTVLLKRHLGWSGVEGILKLWCFSAQYNFKGVYEGHDPSYIEIAIGWRGKKGAFVETLVKLRWLDKTATGYVLHDWEDHNGYVIHADERKEKAKKASAARWGSEYGKKAADILDRFMTRQITQRQCLMEWMKIAEEHNHEEAAGMIEAIWNQMPEEKKAA